MDNFVDQFFSSSSWIEDNAPDGSSWVGGGLNQMNGVLDGAIEAYEGDGMNLATSLTASSDIGDTLIMDDASMFVGGDPNFDFNNSLISTESQPLEGVIDHGSSSSLLGLVDSNLMPNYGNQQPEILHVDLDSITSPSVQPESGSVGSNGSVASEVHDTLNDPPCLPALPPAWNPSTYSGVSSLPHVTVQDTQQNLGLLENYVDANAAFLGNDIFMDGNILQEYLPALLSEQHDLNNQNLSSFADGHQIPLERRADIHPQMQLGEGNSSKYSRDQSPRSQLPPAPVTSFGDCNGTVKPRVRARRGQATDPHSIAERLRREKISERMKNLQELIPKSNKTDKASMLDEIIDYVKFLQLQVKALSMSKLGAAEAGSSLLLPQPAGQGVGPFDCSNDPAFEEEVVKLMESDMNIARQFLETKGLSLMPLALASAISSTKALSSSTSGEGLIYTMTNAVVHHNSEKPGIGAATKIPSDAETSSRENNKIGINGIGRIPNHCNGKIIKQEENFNTEEA